MKGSILETVPTELLPVMRRAAVLMCFVQSLGLSKDTAIQIHKDWGLPFSEMNRLNIVSCPTMTENLLASEVCAFKFDVSDIPGFYGIDRLPCDCAICEVCSSVEVQTDALSHPGEKYCICAVKSWRVDLDPKLAQRGIILPVRDPKRGWICDLQIFRHTRDRAPFILRVRRELAA
jgi:hypothetical protein